MNIISNLTHFNEHLAICRVTVQSEEASVALHATALARESDRYADLAQARALVLAHQVLQQGVTAIQAEGVSSVNVPAPASAPPTLQTTRPFSPPAPETHTFTDDRPTEAVSTKPETTPAKTDESSLPDIPW